MTIRNFDDFRNMIFSLQSEFEKVGKSMASYTGMRDIIDKNKARAQYKEFFEAVEGSVRIVLEALNNELVDIL